MSDNKKSWIKKILPNGIEMFQCPHCNATYKNTPNYCPYCGKEVEIPTATTADVKCSCNEKETPSRRVRVNYESRPNGIYKVTTTSSDLCEYAQEELIIPKEAFIQAYESYILEKEDDFITDWNEVDMDTLIEVNSSMSSRRENWIRRYFYKYEDGKVFFYSNGATSKTAGNTSCVTPDNARLIK